MAERIEVDQEVCIGSANCEYWAPEAFEVDGETGKATVLDPAGDSEEAVEEAIHGCPTGAIRRVEQG